eukprot:scaffold22680_cov107-Cylindrotheca_fusiformis.AAC.27
MTTQPTHRSSLSADFQTKKNSLFTTGVESPARDAHSPSNGMQFPWKVYAMLDDSEAEGYDNIVSWDGDNGFKVHDKNAFVTKIVPRYFSQTKYRSFTRLLNMWGYERIRNGPRKGAYVHKYLCRGQMHLCNNMKCEKIKRSQTAPSSLYRCESQEPKLPEPKLPEPKLTARRNSKNLIDSFGGKTFYAIEGLQDTPTTQEPCYRRFHSLEFVSLVDCDMDELFDL